MGLGIFIPAVVVFAVVRYLTTLPAPSSSSDTGAAALPEGSTVPSIDSSEAWKTLRESCRYLDLGSHIALTFPVWVAAVGIAQVLNGEELSPSVCLMLAIGAIFLIVVCWESPTRQKMFHFAKNLVLARGVDPELLTDEAFIGLSVDCAPNAIGNCSEAVGFINLGDDSCVLHTYAGDTTIPREKVTALTRVTPPGDTMGWVGVRAIGVSWEDNDTDDGRTVYVLARYGETSFSMGAATDMLFDRLCKWAPEHLTTDA